MIFKEVKIKHTLFFFSLLIQVVGFANIDSLNATWKNPSNHDTIRLETLKKIIWENYLFNNPDTAFVLSQQQYVFAKRKNNKKYMAIALNTQGISRVLKGEFNKAIKLYNESYGLFKEINDLKGVANTTNNLGMVYKEMGNHSEALKHYKKSLKIKEFLKDSASFPNTINNIGNVYFDMQSYTLALEYYKRAFELRKSNNDNSLSGSYNNMANVYYEQSIREKNKEKKDKLLERALDYYIKSKQISTENRDFKGLANTLINIGLVLVDKQQLDEALAVLEESTDIQLKMGDEPGLSFSYTNIGSIHAEMENYKQAIDFYNKGFELANKSKSKAQMRDALKGLHLAYSKIGNYEKAYNAVLEYNLYKEEINSEDNQKALIHQQTQHDFEKEQIRAEHEQLEKQRVEEEQTSRRNNLQHSLIFLSILLLFGIILGLGFIKVSPNIAEGLIFFAFLIFFEFLLVFTEPYLEQYTQGEPVYALLANSALALIIFPLHAVLERLLKKKIVK